MAYKLLVHYPGNIYSTYVTAFLQLHLTATTGQGSPMHGTIVMNLASFTTNCHEATVLLFYVVRGQS